MKGKTLTWVGVLLAVIVGIEPVVPTSWLKWLVIAKAGLLAVLGYGVAGTKDRK